MVDSSDANTSSQRNVWFVCQGKTYVPDGGRQYLWAPRRDKSKKKRKHWDNMMSVRKGDLVFHYSSGLRAISRATSDAYENDNPNKHSDWERNGYRVDVETFEFEKPIDSKRLRDNIQSFRELLAGVDGPFDINGKVKQGYLFRFTKKAGELVKDIYGRDFGEPDIDEFFGSREVIEVIEEIEENVISFNHPYRRQLCAIKTKPFLIVAGISGTGKSRLVRTLAYKTCLLKSLQKEGRPENFELIKVKPNWHDTSELIGYMSRINGPSYIAPAFLKFIVKAWKFSKIPFFVCLDEMNLAPVEQYFAEYLSLIETRHVRNGKVYSDALLKLEDFESKQVYEDALQRMGVSKSKNSALWNQFMDHGVTLPANLVVMGTVNMDETTHSFSRKVLDRAMTIEMNHVDLYDGLDPGTKAWDYNDDPITPLNVIGDVVSAAQIYNDPKHQKNTQQIIDYLKAVNVVLDKTPFKIAYRIRDEFIVYCYQNSLLNNIPDDWLDQCLDEMTSMKILARIEGDQARVGDVLDRLIGVVPRTYIISQRKLEEMSDKLRLFNYTSYWI